jgi:L-asparaginase
MANISKILMLYTGGTIGMMQDPESGSLKAFNFQHLLDQIPELRSYQCEISTDSLDRPIDSSDMKPDHWVRLATRIYRDYDNYDGFVILHGSDTMAYSSSALSFLLPNINKPVILTGSQLPIGITRSDARENLLTTLEIALAQKENGDPVVPEVAVYFEYDLFRGNRIHKVSTEDFEAFHSLNYPKLAEAGVNIKYHTNVIANPRPGQLQLHDTMDDNVAVLTVFPGMNEAYVNAILSIPGLKGVVLRTFGSGNAPTDRWFLAQLKAAIHKGIHLVNISQCSGGGVVQGKYEASKALKEMGVISGGDMTFEAGLTKMMFLLGKNLSPEAFREQYQTNLCGELSN